MKSSTKALGVLGLVVLGILAVILGPILTIWSLDTLFPALAIPYTFDTWLATALLGSLFTVRVKK